MNTLNKILITGCLLVLSTFFAQAQTHLKIEVSTQGAGLGVFFNASEQVSGGFAPVNFPEDVYGLGLGVESPLFYRTETQGENKFTLAPRLSYEFHATFLIIGLAARANALYYTNFEKGALTFRPEVGLTSRGSVYLLYGYNLPLQNQELVPTRHQVTFGITIPSIDL
ncbi:MAG TPA: hypothetical protein DCS93_41775 [Microscillaceae bacterium]|nr:hypothetical protein [Microscillaceae bacterium]